MQEFIKIKPIKLALDTSRDARKLQKFLTDINNSLNHLVTACQVQSRLTATELVARPTYAEELENIRVNMPKAVGSNPDGTFSDVAS